MRSLFTTVSVLAIPALLAACNSEPSVTATNASVSDVQNQVAAAGAEAQMKPGRWEGTVTMSTTMPAGMPAQPAQTQNVAACITPDQVKPGANPFSGQLAQGCKYDKFAMQGGKIDATMSCDLQGVKTNGTVAGTFTNEAYNMKSTTEVSGAAAGPMAGMKTESTMDFKRTGECRGDEAGAK